MKAKVSIIIPMYNSAQTLGRCLDSVLSQTYSDIEILAVDDGSADDTGRICKKYADADDRIRYYRQENRGVSAARNKGLEMAAGDLIAWVDGDDWIEPDMIEQLVNVLTSTSSDIAVCGLQRENGDRKTKVAVKERTLWSREEAQKLIIRDEILQSHLCNKLFRKELFSGVEFPLNRKFEDQTVLFKVISKADRIVAIPYVGYHYIDTEGSTVHTYTLQNTVDYYLAVKENKLDAENISADLKPLAVQKMMRAAIPVWCYAAEKEDAELKNHREILQEITGLVQENSELISTCPQVGSLGKVILNGIRLWGTKSLRILKLPAYLYRRRHEDRANA